MEIHKPTLLTILAKQITDKRLFHLCKVIVEHIPTENFLYKGKVPKKGALPPHKTLFHEDKHRGIPIGNLTSQFFANVYLNELDQFVKRGLGVKYYIRYVDDFILLHESQNQLLVWKEKIINFLFAKLHLKLKNEFVYPKSVYRGIDFLGYFVKPTYTLVRRRVQKDYEKIVNHYFPIQFSLEYPFYKKQYPFSLNHYREFQRRVNSYLAHFQYANTHKIQKRLEKRIQDYNSIIMLRNSYIRIPKIIGKFSRFREQIQFFFKSFPKHLLIVPIGRFYEFYGERFLELVEHFQLKTRYRGNLITCGIRIKKNHFEKNLLKQILHFCEKKYISFVLFKEQTELTEKIKIRIPIYRETQIHPVQLELFQGDIFRNYKIL